MSVLHNQKTRASFYSCYFALMFNRDIGMTVQVPSHAGHGSPRRAESRSTGLFVEASSVQFFSSSSVLQNGRSFLDPTVQPTLTQPYMDNDTGSGPVKER